jgi:hypothetical protein
MSPKERSPLESLDAVLRSEDVRKEIPPVIERVRAELARKKEALMTWEPIPLAVFGRKLPAEIGLPGFSSCERARTPAPNGIRTVVSA